MIFIQVIFIVVADAQIKAFISNCAVFIIVKHSGRYKEFKEVIVAEGSAVVFNTESADFIYKVLYISGLF